MVIRYWPEHLRWTQCSVAHPCWVLVILSQHWDKSSEHVLLTWDQAPVGAPGHDNIGICWRYFQFSYSLFSPHYNPPYSKRAVKCNLFPYNLRGEENIINPHLYSASVCLLFGAAKKYFSAAKAAQGMQMSVNPSVSQSVSQSVCHTYLFGRFNSIFYNSKSDKMKLSRILRISSHLTFRSTHVLQYLFSSNVQP